MKKKVIFFFVLLLVAVLLEAGSKGSLHGLVLVLDPGHGGNDPGSHGVFKHVPVYENEYAYDVVKRVEYFAKQRGALVFKTLVDRKYDFHRNDPAWKIMPDNREEFFSFSGQRAYAGGKGLSQRVAYANMICKKYPRHKIVFMAIHFDIAAKGTYGAYSIVPNHTQNPRIAKYLRESFNELNGKTPIKVAGENVKNIFILGSRNHIKEKVLIELGNFQSEKDQWRIRHYPNRTRYALRLVSALEKFMRGS